MKIVHISDLHFGQHNESLAKDLVSRVGKIKPDLIICTGDVVDNTSTDLFETASNYIRELGSDSADCPLAELGEPQQATEEEDKLKLFLLSLNQKIIDGFVQIYLNRKAAPGLLTSEPKGG